MELSKDVINGSTAACMRQHTLHSNKGASGYRYNATITHSYQCNACIIF